MANESRSALTVAAAFAAAMVSAPATHADTAVATEPIVISSAAADPAPEPSPAALQRLEEAAQVAWWWWPIPPKFADLWPEVTHVETIRTA
jgi:hypothetical protein